MQGSASAQYRKLSNCICSNQLVRQFPQSQLTGATHCSLLVYSPAIEGRTERVCLFTSTFVSVVLSPHEEHVFGLIYAAVLERSDALHEAEMPIARRGLAADSKRMQSNVARVVRLALHRVLLSSLTVLCAVRKLLWRFGTLFVS
jgi:hypothetical protein